MSEEYKVSIPLFEPNELATFDNHIHEIIEEYSKMMFKEKDKILTQRIIMKQEQEIERLNNIINELEKEIKWQRKVCLALSNYGVSVCDILLHKLQEIKEPKE